MTFGYMHSQGAKSRFLLHVFRPWETAGPWSAMAQVNDPNKRRFPRYKFDKSVTIGILRGETPQNVHGLCRVLGEGGAAVRTNEQLSVDEIVYLQIPLARRPLRLPASVRNQHGIDYGLEFLALGTTEREYIRSACSAFPRVG